MGEKMEHTDNLRTDSGIREVKVRPPETPILQGT